MSNGAKDTGRVLFMVFGSCVVIGSIAGCVYMFKLLLTPWWIPVSICTIISIALGIPLRGLWRWLTKSDNIAFHTIVNLLVILPFTLCAALTVNYATSGRNETDEKVVVNRVYWETHYKTRRVGRRTYTRGAPYKVYYLSLTLGEGHNRDVQVLKKTYDRLVKGDTIGVHVSKGALGMKVFNGSNFILPPKVKKESRSEKIKRKNKERMRRIYREHQEMINSRSTHHIQTEESEND